MKSNPRLKCEDIYSYIAAQTNLSFEDVRSCFMAYSKMIRELAINKYTDKSLTIPLPHIGTFYFQKFKGRKSGSTYHFFDKSKKVVIEEEEPSFYYIKLKVSMRLRDILKEHTKFYEE